MYFELNSTGVILINIIYHILLSLNLDYHFHMYSMHDPNR
jgi:hypothetical protein